ncbi:MAG: DUF6089 family protein [Tannerella sp.]|nr:DUF6089 family protein [Tannerella sp.]
MMTLSFFRLSALPVAFLWLVSHSANAQEYLYEIGGMLGGAFYMGDANKTTLFADMNPAASAIFRYNANYRVAFRGNLAWARISGSTARTDNVFPDNAQIAFERNVIDLGAQAEFNFFPYSDIHKYLYTKRISPYIAGGFGLSAAPVDGEMFFSPHLSAGTGVKYKLKNRLNIGAELSVRKLFGDGLDNKLLNDPYGTGSDLLKNRDWYVWMKVFITYDFGLRDCNCNKKETKEIY